MVGKIQDEAVVEDGKVVPAKILTVRYSYDERIDDGLSTRKAIFRVNEILRDPYKHLGCLDEDVSTHHSMVAEVGD